MRESLCYERSTFILNAWTNVMWDMREHTGHTNALALLGYLTHPVKTTAPMWCIIIILIVTFQYNIIVSPWYVLPIMHAGLFCLYFYFNAGKLEENIIFCQPFAIFIGRRVNKLACGRAEDSMIKIVSVNHFTEGALGAVLWKSCFLWVSACWLMRNMIIWYNNPYPISLILRASIIVSSSVK